MRALRAVLALAGLAGVLCLTIATFSAVIRIEVGTTTHVSGADTLLSGWERHGPALVVLAVLALALLGAALRGMRVAALAVAAAGVAALAIALIWDRPHVHDSGQVGQLYDDARANPGAGYYLETAGGVLLLTVGGLLLLQGGPEAAPAQRRRPQAPAADDAA